MHAQRGIWRFVVGGGDGHLARFGLNFVAERGDGLHHAGAGAVWAWLAEHALERLLGALAGDADEAEFVEGQRLGWSFVLLEGLLQRHKNFLAVAALFHVDEVNHDDAAEVTQANLPDDFFHGFEVGLDDSVFEARGALADEFAGVDVDGHERFGVVDDDVAAGLEPDFRAQSFVQFVLDAELLEDRRFLAVQFDAIDELGLEAADEFDDLAVFLFAVDPDGREIVADVIAKDALDEIQVAVEKRGRFALLAALLDFVPGLAEELDVRANFFIGSAARRGSNDEATGVCAARFTDQPAEARAVFGGSDFARDADVIDRRHVHQEAAGQRDVAGDARAFLAERLLGDLDDDVLAGLQHLGNELRAARRSGVATLMTVRTAGTAFESRTAAGTAAATIWPATAAVVAIASAAAIRPLEACAGIAANARGVAREIRAGFGSAGARGACFAGKKDTVVFGDDGLGRGFGSGGLDGFVFVVSFLVNFVIADGSGVQRAFVGGVCFRFAECVSVQSACLDSLDLFRTNILGLGFRFAGANLFAFFNAVFRFGLFVFFFVFLFVLRFLFLFLFVFFLEDRATDERVGRRVRLRFFVLGLDEAGGNNSDVFVAERSIGASTLLLDDVRCGTGRLRSRGCSVIRGGGQFFRAGRRCFGFVAGFRKQPARQAAGGAARKIRTGRCTRLLNIAAGRNGVSEIRLRFVNLRLYEGRRGNGRGGRGLVAVLCQGFARQYDFVLAGTYRSGRRAEARSFRATSVARLESAALLTARVVAAARIVRALIALRRRVL